MTAVTKLEANMFTKFYTNKSFGKIEVIGIVRSKQAAVKCLVKARTRNRLKGVDPVVDIIRKPLLSLYNVGIKVNPFINVSPDLQATLIGKQQHTVRLLSAELEVQHRINPQVKKVGIDFKQVCRIFVKHAAI